MPMSGAAKVAYERERRARLAIAAGREPHRTGRPRTGRRAPHGRGDVLAQRARRRERERVRSGDAGWTPQGHPVIDAAYAVALRYARPDRRSLYLDPLFEEALMTAALAIIEGSDPDAAARSVVASERDHRHRTCPLDGRM